ncbi:hypothetical protein BD311DRAFT_744604 [Dichomitus squalens]|uniref:Uncharacterized protein n=1 Tax=Dichomitus squalens TaxID=114155 RepID=A0A4Q9N6R5_9APHY|nr:hypothetical protein BD311DRAFT_744604 [Dichomitus squalens]
MRLLHTTTGQFHEVDDGKLEDVQFAILSYMYAYDKEVELSFKDLRAIQQEYGRHATPRTSPTSYPILSPTSPPAPHASVSPALSSILSSEQPRSGCVLDDYRMPPKIRNACTTARNDNLDYIWINSCCVDDDSTLESSEAIRMTFHRFSRAAVCYAYLADVSDLDTAGIRPQDSRIRRSRWFTRGWTLQELIAPKSLVFVSQNWTPLGTKQDLAEMIAQITGIEESVLTHRKQPSDVSVARRMFWASRRRATRVEDEAYSLMGLFGVDIEPVYGEGHQAFFRLQQAILLRTQDQSLFAWEIPSTLDEQRKVLFPMHFRVEAPPPVLDSALFARSPSDFAGSHDIDSFVRDRALGSEMADGAQYTFTPYGLRTRVPLIPTDSFLEELKIETSPPWLRLAILACGPTLNGEKHFVALLLSHDQEASPFDINVLIPLARLHQNSPTDKFSLKRLVTISQSSLASCIHRQSLHHETIHLSSPDYVAESVVTVKRSMATLSKHSYERLRARGYVVKDESIGTLWFPLRRLTLSKADMIFEVEYGSTRHGDEAAIYLVVKECPPLTGGVLGRCSHVVPGSTHWVHNWTLTEFHLTPSWILSFGLECIPASWSYRLNVIETALDTV